MKKLSFIAGAVALFALLSGCAKNMQLNDPALYDQYLTRSYNQPRDVCYNAVLVTFRDRGVDLTKADPEEGKIVTEKHLLAIYAGYGVVGSISHRYYIDVKGDENKCTIKVTKYKAWKGGNEVPYVDVDEIYTRYWAPLFGGFESNFDSEDEISVRTSGDIDQVVKQRTPDLQKIYDQYRKKNKTLQGKVTLKFTIAPDGDIIAISVVDSNTGDSNFDEIIKMAVSTWTFGKVTKGNTTVTIPFTFSE